MAKSQSCSGSAGHCKSCSNCNFILFFFVGQKMRSADESWGICIGICRICTSPWHRQPSPILATISNHGKKEIPWARRWSTMLPTFEEPTPSKHHPRSLSYLRCQRARPSWPRKRKIKLLVRGESTLASSLSTCSSRVERSTVPLVCQYN